MTSLTHVELVRSARLLEKRCLDAGLELYLDSCEFVINRHRFRSLHAAHTYMEGYEAALKGKGAPK